MRVALLMARASPWSVEIAVGLADRGLEIHVIDFDRPLAQGSYLSPEQAFLRPQIELLENGVAAVHLLPTKSSGPARYFTHAYSLRGLTASISADVSFSLGAGGYAFLATTANVRPRAIYAVGSDVLLISRRRRPLIRRMLRAADAVAVNGRYLHRKLAELSPQANARMIYMGVDDAKYKVSTKPTEPPTRFLCSRGFQPLYNNEAIVRTATEFEGTGSEATFVFPAPGETLDECRSLAVVDGKRRAGITFLGGVGPEEMFNHLNTSHVYVSMSRSDGTSTSLLEALSCGLFPVISDIPQNREWIDPSLGNGILVPLDDDEALLASLYRVVESRQERRDVAPLNHDLVASRASRARGLDDLTTMLEQVAYK